MNKIWRLTIRNSQEKVLKTELFFEYSGDDYIIAISTLKIITHTLFI